MYELKQQLGTVNGTSCYYTKPKILQIHIYGRHLLTKKCFLYTFRTIWGEKKA